MSTSATKYRVALTIEKVGLRKERGVSTNRKQEEIAQSFSSAGWEVDGSFADELVIGFYGDNLSILAHQELLESDDELAFEILDHERNITYWVEELLTPQQALELLQDHDQLLEQQSDEDSDEDS